VYPNFSLVKEKDDKKHRLFFAPQQFCIYRPRIAEKAAVAEARGIGGAQTAAVLWAGSNICYSPGFVYA
jgi:hypothetical protein